MIYKYHNNPKKLVTYFNFEIKQSILLLSFYYFFQKKKIVILFQLLANSFDQVNFQFISKLAFLKYELHDHPYPTMLFIYTYTYHKITFIMITSTTIHYDNLYNCLTCFFKSVSQKILHIPNFEKEIPRLFIYPSFIIIIN